MAENCSPDTQGCQSNNTLEVVNSSGSLDESQVPQSTPASGKGKGIGWLEEHRAASMKRKGIDQDSQSTAKRGARTGITKQTANNGNHRNGRTQKKETEATPDMAENRSRYTKKENIQPSRSASVSYKFKGEKVTVPMNDEALIDFIQTIEGIKKSDNVTLLSHTMEATLNPYVPCSALPEGECFEIKKSKGKQDQIPHTNYCVREGGLFFKVNCKGITKNGGTKIILRSNNDCLEGTPLAVFGFPDETIEEAIRNDKRFHIKGKLSLKDPNEKGIKRGDLPLSSLKANVVYGIQPEKMNAGDTVKTPKTQNKRRSNQTSCSKGSLNTEDTSSNVPHTSSDPKREPLEQTIDLPENYRSATSQKFSGEINKIICKIGGTTFTSDMIEEYTREVIYKKPMPAKVHRLLTKHLDSVALIRYPLGDKIKVGTFFLLTETVGLTCHHVLEPLLEGLDWKKKPNFKVEILFRYEAISDQKQIFQVQAEFWNDRYDFVFLRLLPPHDPSPQKHTVSNTKHEASSSYYFHASLPQPNSDQPHNMTEPASSELPHGLLDYVGRPPEGGAVSIIGHPGGSFKQIDPHCLVINFSKRAEYIHSTIHSHKSYIHVLTQHNFQTMSRPDLVTYDTCLYKGASGAPVFDGQGRLVAMHTGGYPVNTDLEKKSIIEYGVNLFEIVGFGRAHIRELRTWVKKKREGSMEMQSAINKFRNPDQPNMTKNQNPDCTDSEPMDTSM